MALSTPRRCLTVMISAIALIVALLAPLGCQRAAPPVEQTDWRSHLRSPSSLRRNWVLPNNTMLAEIESAPGSPIELAPNYLYQVYDPRADAFEEIVPVPYRACLRSISEQNVEFVAGNFTGARYVLRYDLRTRELSVLPAWYQASERREFGLTNANSGCAGAVLTANGVVLQLTDHYSQPPYFVVRPDTDGGELLLEFPGVDNDRPGLPQLTTSALPKLVTGAVLTDGVRGIDGVVVPGVTLHLKLQSPDWARLAFGVIGPRSARTTDWLTLSLTEDVQPTDLQSSFEPPEHWDDWAQWAAPHSMPVAETWPLADGLLLVQWKEGLDTAYGLCDLRERTVAVLIGMADRAVPLSIAPDHVELLGDLSGINIGNWPYRILVDPQTRTYQRSSISVRMSQAIGFGGATSVLKSVVPVSDGLRLRFTGGPILAGGGGLPRITTLPDPAAHQLLVRIHNAECYADYAAEKLLTLGPVDVRGIPFLTAAILEKGIVNASGRLGPGVTLRLTFDASAWDRLTYHVEGREPSADPPAPGDEFAGSTDIVFSDREPATDISAIVDRMGLDAPH